MNDPPVAPHHLSEVTLHRVRMEMARPWHSPVAAFATRDVLLVSAVVDGVTGWGECVAQPEPTYAPEYVEGAIDVLARHLIPRALAAQDAASVPAALAPVKGHPMARSGLTTAVLDATLRGEGRSLAEHLARPGQAVPEAIPVGVVVGVADDREGLLAECAERAAEGYRRIKLKLGPGTEPADLRAVQEAVGEGVALQVDANGSFAPLGVEGAAAALAPFDELGLLLIEQPLGDDDLLGHAALGARLRTPLCLDEAITSPDVAATALALGACRIVNIKPGRVGGLSEAVAIHDRCAAAGVPAWCGGMLESGVGRATNLALAALPGFTLPGDLSAAGRYWVEDVVAEPATLRPDGTIAVPGGPGIGVEIRDDLAGRTVWTATWGCDR